MSEKQESDVIAEEVENAAGMFASVWVKVEVDDMDEIASDNEDYNSCLPLNQDLCNVTKNEKKVHHNRKIFQCDTCEYTTKYKNCYDLHIIGHKGLKPFICDLCSYATKHPTSLNRHILIKHPERSNLQQIQGTLKCDHCDYTTNFKWNLNAHKRKHKAEKQFKCSFCSYETAYRHNFLKHSRVHNKEEVLFKCDKCPFETKYAGHIERHLAKIHQEVMDRANRCDLCEFATKEKWRLNIHKQRSKKENAIKCSYCDFTTHFTCESKKHKSSHYSEIYGNGRAINCSNLKNEIKAMIAETGNTNNFDHVDATAEINEDLYQDVDDSEEFMNSHEQIHHYKMDPDCVDWSTIPVLESDDKDKPFQCHMCTYTSKFKASVQRHFQRHHTGTQNRPFKCRNCDFSTKTKDQIALHNKRSQSNTVLHCKLCKFTTKFKCQQVLHQKRHYTHRCAICNYTCRHKYELTKHYATLHMGTGLKCQYCDYTARRKESILCHETVHTGIKPFRCSLCEYSSVRKSLLDNHKKRYHSTMKNELTVVSKDKIESLKLVLDEKKYGNDITAVVTPENDGVDIVQ